MILLFESRTAWAGDLIADVIRLNNPDWRADEDFKLAWYNLRNDLVRVAEVILTRKNTRTAEVLCPEINRLSRVLLKTRAEWEFKNFTLIGHVGGTDHVFLYYSDKSLMLEIKHTGKVVTWEQDVMVLWLARYNAEILRLPVCTEENLELKLGEFLAALLYRSCGDIAGHNATLDAAQDRRP